MPRVHPLFPSSNAGEFSPRMVARTDFAKYPNAAETLENVVLTPQGGWMRRPGTIFIGEVSDSSAQTELLPFIFNTEQAYMVEAGDNYFRFYKDQGQIFVDTTDAAVTNGTFDSDISGWTNNSTASASIAWDSTNLDMELTVTAASNSAWAEQSITIGASYQSTEHVLAFRVKGTPGDKISLRVGTTSTGNELINDDEYAVGWHTVAVTPGTSPIYLQFGQGEIKTVSIDDISFLSDQAVEIETPYATAVLPEIRTAQTADVMYLVQQNTPVYRLTRYGHPAWSLEEVLFFDGPYQDVNTDEEHTLDSPATGINVTVTASKPTFVATDVGRSLRIESNITDRYAFFIIKTYTSATSVNGDFIIDRNNTAPEVDWALGSWSETTGYPRTVGFIDQRMVLAGSPTEPQNFWLSQSADIENMAPDSDVEGENAIEDDDAIVFRMAAQEANAVEWLLPGQQLIFGTNGGEWIASSSGASFTPTDIDVKRQTSFGANSVPPVRVGHTPLFIQRAGRTLYELGFSLEIEGWRGSSLTILADHITESRITGLVYAQEPHSIVHAVRNDGQIASLTHQHDQEVIGWSRAIVGGNFGGRDAVVEAIATIPGNEAAGSIERDEVWVIVKRTVDGSTVRYIEMFAGDYEVGDNVEASVYLDSALTSSQWNTTTTNTLAITGGSTWLAGETGLTLTAVGHTPFLSGDVGDIWAVRYKGVSVHIEITAYTSSSVMTVTLLQDCLEDMQGFALDEWLDPDDKSTSVTGLDHLEGETVRILADAADAGTKTVSSGSIILDEAAGAVVVGLPYEHKYQSLKLDFGAHAGTAVNKTKRVDSIAFVFNGAGQIKLGPDFDNLRTVPFRVADDPMGAPVPLFVGEKRLAFDGNWDRDPRICISDDAPLPWHLLAMVPDTTVNPMT
ncbi:MAG: hypothetical protein GY953_39310 [bacterium]|nr:hypothetical protein [bacterium]